SVSAPCFGRPAAPRFVSGRAARAARVPRRARRVDRGAGRVDQLALALDQVRAVRPSRDLDSHRVILLVIEQRPSRYHHGRSARPARARSTLVTMRDRGAILLVACYELSHQPLAVARPAAFLAREGSPSAVVDSS